MVSGSPIEFFATRRIERALLSVSDKNGLVDFARTLALVGVELISTGGTREMLVKAGLEVRDISEVTNFPEMLDGRVKTLHPFVHAGILARRDDPAHLQTLEQHGIKPIDLVVCNLYPFSAAVAKPEATISDAIENIDIGGPTLVRAAAKNYAAVAIVTDPDQYSDIAKELVESNGSLALRTREKLATSAFLHVAAYDAAIADYFRRHSGKTFPRHLTLSYDRKQPLRYGENPHQRAAFYVEHDPPRDSVSGAEVLHGKELSFNNILDLDSAVNLAREFEPPAAVIVKHNNPCGAAIAATIDEAYQKAFDGDPVSAFGGILALNRPLDEATANKLAEPDRFFECIIAPDYEPEAFKILTTRPTWSKNVRLLKTGPLAASSDRPEAFDLRRVDGGVLVQLRSAEVRSAWKCVTERQPTDQEQTDLEFAWLVVKHVKSNAIVLARNGMVIGVGAGQMSRIDSVRLAIEKAVERKHATGGAVLASDAFFPFSDWVRFAVDAGIKAAAHPGGSKRDAESIAACNEHGIAMLFTGVRHFRH